MLGQVDFKITFIYNKNMIKEYDLKQIGERIKALRKMKKLTQIEFSNACNFDRTYLSRVENGKQNITMDKFLLICESLNLKPKDFFDF